MKRFINIQSIFAVKDNITGEEYRYRHGVLDEELIDCMNKLYEENLNLKQTLWEAEEYLHKVYHDNPIRLQDKIINLKEECDKEYRNETVKYCSRDCIHFESDYHWDGNKEWEEVNCALGHSEIHDTAYYTYCEDYDDGGKYND